MKGQGTKPSSAEIAYDAFAPFYDEFNAQNDYETWLGLVLLPELEKHGLRLGRVLDIGCGTGRAFKPMIRRGWDVHGCDISEGMLLQAHRKYPEVPLRCSDATDLPTYDRSFDLILILNDVVNHLIGDGDLERCFEGVARNLAPGGLICLDALTLETIRASFTSGATRRVGGWIWTGEAASVEVGGVGECQVSGLGVESNHHRVRHWPARDLTAAAESAALCALTARGQQEVNGRIVLADPDAGTDERTIFILGHRA